MVTYLTILAYNLSFKYGIDALIFCERFLDSDLSDGLTNIFFSFLSYYFLKKEVRKKKKKTTFILVSIE